MPETLPSRIGRYEIRGELGRGMMGVVYEAFDPELHRTVALKTLSLNLPIPDTERAAFEQRFLNEARAAAGLSHPNIVVVYDVGRDPETGVPFMSLEHLQGVTLAQIALPLPASEALRIVARLAEALSVAHARGIVHRDIKPANIMLLPSGQPKIMDFGIAKVPASQLTAAGQVFGTPSNMSPEQAMGEPLDARSDLFSLGTVLYQLLTARRAFDATELRSILGQVVHQDPPSPSQVMSGLPRGTDEVVARALAKQPARRYQDGAAMARDLEDVLSGRAAGVTAAAPVAPAADGPLAGLVQTVRPGAAAATIGQGVPAATPDRRRGRWTSALAGAALLVVLAALAGRFAGRSPQVDGPPAGPAAPPRSQDPRAATRDAGPPAPAEPVSSPSEDTSRLIVDFDHSLREGQLEVWVDEALVLDRSFRGRVSRELGKIKLSRGTLDDEVEMTPGRHDVRVRVHWDDNTRTETISGTFRPGATRILEIRLGWLRKNLSLAWK